MGPSLSLKEAKTARNGLMANKEEFASLNSNLSFIENFIFSIHRFTLTNLLYHIIFTDSMTL
jgi:hypothetical protein